MNTNQPLAELFGDRGTAERVTSVAPLEHVVVDQLPWWDEQMLACKIGRFTAELIEQRDYLLNRSRGERVFTHSTDTQEIRSLCGKAAAALGPVIGEATELQDAHERVVAEIKKGVAV